MTTTCRFAVLLLMFLSPLVMALDSDRDTLTNDWEIAHASDPFTPRYQITTAVDGHYIGHACALSDSGVTCWGDNTYGQTTVPALTNPKYVLTGASYSCALDSGTGWICWGDNTEAQHSVPAIVGTLKEASSMGLHGCLIDDEGVKCWGWNGAGQTVVPANLVNPRSLSTSEYNTCLIDDAGVHCWGNNSYNQLTIPLLVNPVAVAAGRFHVCAADDNGVTCWGDNTYHQGNAPSGLTGVRQLAASPTHTCALSPVGVTCWDDVDAGPLVTPPLVNPAAIAVGFGFSCALDEAGIQCWGNTSNGETNVLANFDTDGDSLHNDYEVANGLDRLLDDTAGDIDNDGLSNLEEYNAGTDPQNNDSDGDGIPDEWEVTNDLDPLDATDAEEDPDQDALINYDEYWNDRQPWIPDYLVSAGWLTTCGKDDVAVSCWGALTGGQNVIPALTNPYQLEAGQFHVCALDQAGVTCWGSNGQGQTNIPVMSSVVQISTLYNHTCAVHSSGVGCWGADADGQSTVPFLINPVQVSAGKNHSCALEDRGVICWGSNVNGQSSVPALSNPVSVSAGDSFTCAMDDSGVKCWGLNTSGQSTAPVMSGVTQIGSGGDFACALYNGGGSIRCWGSNAVGQRTPPTLINPALISVGNRHACALHDGGISCWGRNTEGQTETGTLVLDTDGDGLANSADVCPYLEFSIDNDSDCIVDDDDEDDDNDGMPDAWEITYGFNPLSAADSSENPDGDYANNAQEYAGGTDPLVYDVNNPDDMDDDKSYLAEENLAGTDPNDPGERPYWWRTFNGDSAGDSFGYSVSKAGDVNNDGYDDVIVGAYQDDNNGNSSGSARVLSGKTGDILYTFNGDSAGDILGYSVRDAGDVNGDGYADVIVGAMQDDNTATDSGSARVFSGVNGSILYTFNGDSAGDNFGNKVSGAGDVNGDGYDDVIVGAFADDNTGTTSGSARIFSGVDGSILYTFNGDSAGDQFGDPVSDAGDVNGDGYGDVIVGAAFDDNNGTDSGSARVLSGQTGTILYTFNGDGAGDLFGGSVSGAGDVNSDGYADLIVGALQDDNNGLESGSARVFSGKTGAILFTVNGDSAGDRFGLSVRGVGDVNGDGDVDVIVGAYQDDNNGSNSGSARIFTGKDGSILYTFSGDSANDFLGFSVSGAGDMDGDSYADFIVGAYQDDNNGSNSGSARVFLSSDLFNDLDLDYLINSADPDDDNDGTPDVDDDFPTDPDESIDTDNDGTGDNADTDDDGDTWLDADESFCGSDPLNVVDIPQDTDGDGDCNGEDLDDDGDHWLDVAEVDCGTNPLMVSVIPADNDLDLVCDSVDLDDDNDSLEDLWEQANSHNPLQADYLVDAGWNTSCGRDDQGVRCWGSLTSGQGAVPALTNVRQLAVGQSHVCALDEDGVACWGANGQGQLNVPAMNGVTSISSLFNHTCAVHSSGVSCWGSNSDGQSAVPALSNPVQVSAGKTHSCALADNGVVCWGANGDGQLNVPALSNPMAVASGDRFTCAIDEGAVVCWGLNGSGQAEPPPLANTTRIDAGVGFACAVYNDGTAVATCWGDDSYGQQQGALLLDGLAQSSVGSLHTCALDVTGINCWGRNQFGQIENDFLKIDVDLDGSVEGEEYLAGTDRFDPDVRPYWWYTFNGNSAQDEFGRAVSDAGDVNNDGYDDIIVGAYGDDDNGTNSGSARVISGLDRRVLYHFNGDGANDLFAWSVSGAGDVNNDGYADLVAGAHFDDNNGSDSGSVKIFSGQNGAVLHLLNGSLTEDFFGYSVSGAGDVNNDGYADVIIGAYGVDTNGSESGAVKVISGSTGTALYTFNGDNADDRFGFRVSGAGDINKDNYDDIIVGAYWDDNNGNNSGSARVFSGVNGAVLYTVYGDAAGDWLGFDVGEAGDVNGDTYADFFVGASRSDINGADSGMIRVYSGVNGAVLYTVAGDNADDRFGYAISPIGDLSGDGYPDLLVGAYQNDEQGADNGSVYVLSGVNGQKRYQLSGDSAGDFLGYAASRAGDINGDGYDDILAGAYQDDNAGVDSGSARIFLSSDLFNDTDLDFVINSADTDSDNDGWDDTAEVLCGTNPNNVSSVPADNDADFSCDLIDTDDDNDGVLDGEDDFPNNPAETVDTDGDGTGNNSDPDDDGDGMSDVWELANGFNPLVNDASGDADVDGMTNEEEFSYGLDPNDPADALEDMDGDGLTNVMELRLLGSDPETGSVTGTGKSYVVRGSTSGLYEINLQTGATTLVGNSSGAVDREGLAFANDGRLFLQDDTTLYLLSTVNGARTLVGSIPHASGNEDFAIDADNQGWMASSTSLYRVNINTGQSTLVGNLSSNNALGVFNNDLYAMSGNALYRVNKTTAARTLVGALGVTCSGENDLDSDGQNLWALCETQLKLYTVNINTGAATFQTNIASPWEGFAIDGGSTDADEDGMHVDYEEFFGLDDSDASDAALDNDLDGLTNLEEFQNNTNPNAADSDGGGISDYVEVQTGTKPYVAADDDVSDTDADGLYDVWEQHHFGDLAETGVGDTDSDTLNNIGEQSSLTNPNVADTDMDGALDGMEVHVFFTNPLVADANNDADGEPDVYDTDDDNDGTLDVNDTFPFDPAEAVDTDGDGSGNNADTDDDNDSMPDVWEIANGLDPLLNDRNGDLDGDGVSNWVEYLHGTNPAVLDHAKPHDFDGDRDGDIFLRNQAAGLNLIWRIQNAQKAGNSAPGHNAANYEIVGVSDLESDGDQDLVWKNKVTQELTIWIMQNAAKQSTTYLGVLSHILYGIGDFDGDRHQDLLLVTTSNQLVVWRLVNGVKQSVHFIGALPSGYTVIGSSDFNNDGDDDVLLRSGAGNTSVWEIENFVKLSNTSLGTLSTQYVLAGIADFDQDGDDDVVWRHVDGSLRLWIMEAHALLQNINLGAQSLNYTLVDVGDMNADHDADLLFYNTSSREVLIWDIQGATKTNISLGLASAGLAPLTTTDYDADGDRDILLRNSNTGEFIIWVLEDDGKKVAAENSLGVIGIDYAVVDPDENIAGGDIDADTLPDEWELSHFSNLSQTAAGDFDGDGLSNLQEYEQGTDPKSTDSDTDTIPDGYEVASGMDPLVNDVAGDVDHDAISNLEEYVLGLDAGNSADALQDLDGDGLSNVMELRLMGSDPESADIAINMLPESEPNDSIAVHQNINVLFGRNYSVDIGNNAGSNTSTSIPHITLQGTGNDTRDYYGFSVSAGDTGIFDIDCGDACGGSFDSYLRLYDSSGTLIATDDDSSLAEGAGGSLSTHDSLLTYTFASAGNYFIKVSRYSDEVIPTGATYLLQVSLTNRVFGSAYDNDGDGMGDPYEAFYGLNSSDSGDIYLDADNDGLTNLAEFQGNTNPLLPDSDGDGLADIFEIAVGTHPLIDDVNDSDTDGLADEWEIHYFTSLIRNGTGDFDSDGLTDQEEYDTYTNPVVADTDADGLSDGDEVNLHGTNPFSADTDLDGMPDQWELTYGLDPLSALDANTDADLDGFTNLQEFENGTNPSSTDSGAYAISDFDRDGDDDLLLRNVITGDNVIWLLENGVKTTINALTTNALTFDVAAVIDGDNDGDTDILWYDSVQGKLIFWQIEGGIKQGNAFLGNTTATLDGVGDFDGDGDMDILLKTALGDVKIWTIENLVRTLSTNVGTPEEGYMVVDMGDFNRDGIDDIVMQNAAGAVRIWQLNSSAQLAQTIDVATISTAYKLKKSGDTDNDGDDDLIFRNDTTGQSIVWEMENGARVVANTISGLNPSMNLATVTDFDKDGDEDLMFRDSTTGDASDGDTIIWKMQDNIKQSNSFLGNNAVTFLLEGTLDMDSDGDFDILYRDNITGQIIGWNMQNGAKAGNYNIGNPGTAWEPRF